MLDLDPRLTFPMTTEFGAIKSDYFYSIFYKLNKPLKLVYYIYQYNAVNLFL